MAPAKAPPIGDQDMGRVADFMQGVRESRDQRAKTAAIMVGAYVGVRALQHWSAWKRQQGRWVMTAENVVIAGLRQRCAEFGLTTTGDESIEELQEALGYLRAATTQELLELPNDDQPEDG